MPLDPKPLKTIHRKGEKNPVALGSGLKMQITVVGCVSAGGYCLPPIVIWDRKRLKPELTVGEVLGTLYGLSKKGWIDQELFDAWFNSLFWNTLRWHVPFFFSWMDIRIIVQTLREWLRTTVIMFALPPNTTHLMQPLDKGCFGPLKIHWRRVCHQFMVDNPLKVVNCFNFSKLFHSAWVSAMTSNIIMAGFKTTWVYPTDCKAILLPGAFKSSHPSLGERSGLKFIPLYNPSHWVSSPGKEVHFSDAELQRFEVRLRMAMI